MREKIKGINIQAANAERARSKQEIAAQREKEQRGEIPRISNSPLQSYANEFQSVLPEGVSLKDFLREKLAHKKGDAIGVELGGVGSQLFEDLGPGVFKKTAGVNLTDYRRFLEPDPTPRDIERNHTVIEGDILRKETQEKVKEWLNGEPVDLFVERLRIGQTIFPTEPFLVGRHAGKWYKMAGKDSITLAEVPFAFSNIIKPWEKNTKENHPGLDVVVDEAGKNLLLEKKEGAPEELPVFDAQRVKEEVERRGKHAALGHLFTE